MLRKIVLMLLVMTQTEAIAQNEDSLFIRRIADHILTKGRSYDDLRVLTKNIGHRLAGSRAMVQSENWAESTMKAIPADLVWRQQCMVPHWDRGGRDEAFVTIRSGGKNIRRNLDALALGNSIGSMKPLTAEVIEIKNFDDLEQKKEQVRGKIVFFNVAFDPRHIGTFRSYSEAVQYRGSGPIRAAAHGAVGVVIRSMSHSTDNFPHTGSTRYVDSIPRIPAIAIGLRDADWLSSYLQTAPAQLTLLTKGKFLPDAVGHNIIGELRGSQFPDEIITVGGHLDSWDVGEGAHDDGAGCVQTIEILRAFKELGYQPKRTIRFVMFANEENGLRGGNKYAEEAASKKEKHVFALESDAGGFTPRGFDISATDDQFSRIESWRSLLSPYGSHDFNRGGGGADIGPLHRALGTPMAGLRPDSQRYFDYHHARNDVFEAVNKRELQLGAINMAALIYLIDKYGL